MTLLPSQLFPNAYLSSGKGNIYLLHIVRADSILLKSCFYYRLGVVVCLFVFTSHAHFNEVQSLTFLLELRNIASSSLYCLWEKGEGLAPLPGY